MKKILLFSAILFLGLTAFSQSLLWKVSGNKIKSPSYVYGTIHIADQRVFAFDSTVLNALSSCDALCVEILLDEIDVNALREMMYLPKGQTLSGLLSKEDFKKLDSVCKATLGVSVMFMNTMKPFFLMSAIQQMAFSQDKAEALDLFFLKTARAQKKDCYGLERYEDQIGAIDKISVKEQVEMLLQMFNDTTSSITDASDSLLQAYLTFDFDKMLNMASDESLPGDFDKVLIDKRNVTMAKGFEKYAKKQTVFCGVGAAHLAGPKGILELLKKKGYTVEPVPFEWITEE